MEVTQPLAPIEFADFARVDIRAGTVTRAESFPQARKPALKVWVDFGPTLGVRQTSAQITAAYTPEGLIGKTVLGCVNLGEKKIAGFTSQFLRLGLTDAAGAIRLASCDTAVQPGQRLH